MSTDNDTKPFAVTRDGVFRVPGFDLPLSAALSAPSRAMLAGMFNAGIRMNMPDARTFHSEVEFKQAVDEFRRQLDSRMRPASEHLLKALPVTITPWKVEGVAIEEFNPLSDADPTTVLINLHGGAFLCGQTYIGRIESIPIAHRGKFRVISVDYRQGYEHKFPAASEDVATVYRALLKDYAAEQIGIYGASAGGVLAAQATAWMIQRGLPVPGAIGILSAGTGGAGDSDYFAAIGVGQAPPYQPLARLAGAPVGYFSGAESDDALVDPIHAPVAFRAKFPPTLLITGTRAFDLSPALATHRALVQAGVDACLHVFDGHAHGFFYDAMTPESVDAYNTVVNFFRKHLKPGS